MAKKSDDVYSSLGNLGFEETGMSKARKKNESKTFMKDNHMLSINGRGNYIHSQMDNNDEPSSIKEGTFKSGSDVSKYFRSNANKSQD